jgi:hypothetical protein
MADIERYTPDDRRGIEQLYRRTFGIEAAERVRLRWDWARRNPASGVEPPYWVVREGPTLIAACSLTPVRVVVAGTEVAGACLNELRWPKPLAMPCLVKPISRRALRRPTWPVAINRLVSALTLPVVRVVSRARPLREEVELIRRFDSSIDDVWERVAPRFGLAVRRDARYLNWKFLEPPHVRYTAAVLKRGTDVQGYAIYRHLREPQGRVTQIVDLFADPSDERGLKTLVRWVDREAQSADSDKIRCYATHASLRRVLRRSGYFAVKSDIDLTMKVNAVDVPRGFFESTDRWHFTLGDGDLDH